MSKREKKSGCLVFFLIILIIILIGFISIFVLYTKDPIKLQENLENIVANLENYANELSGLSVNKEDNLKMPEKEELTEAQNYYYYEQLDEPAKKIYVTIENNIENLKNGVENIPLPASLNEVAKSNASGKELIAMYFQNAWDAFISDKSEYFYLDSSKVCLVTKIITKGQNVNYEFAIGKGDNKTYFVDEFETKEDVESAIKEVENVKNEILKNATGSNYDKILYVHNWIVENTEYDKSRYENTANLYSCIVDNKAICEGYARTFKYLLDELNIPCILIIGSATDENGKTEKHAWNYVYLQNNWYAVDTTWDDPVILGSGKLPEKMKYKYFLKGEESIAKDHHIIGQVTKDGYKFTYPDLASEDFATHGDGSFGS